MCQQCRNDGDCAAGQQCNAGRCDPIPGYCRSDDDCGPGEACLENRCQGPQSLDDGSAGAANGDGQCSIETVYFDFDSSTISAAARSKIEGNIRCMQTKGITTVHLTGHCDPRGTEEYNLALGDRRAQSVRKIAVSMGMASGKVTASSMGEEMAQGEDESAWAKDRRVEFTTK
ncbi:MAG: OmpA family protein [Myxococcales bacterium]|nr:MAG: OmpA family protein [Myxococcales bacterium]